jgi:pre-mRNA-splicing factor ATP-dependent RNA helicase DHX15/PRP43
MSSTPKRQKNSDESYTPTSTDNSDPNLKRKEQPQNGNDPNDPLLAAYNNPYLAHMLPEQPQVGAGRGPLRDFRRRATTAKQAEKAEDGPDNPFTLRPLSRQYFDILKKRRDLPVHAQRYIRSIFNVTKYIDKSFWICTIRHKSLFL